MEILTDDQLTDLFNQVYDSPGLIQHLTSVEAKQVLTRVEHRLDPVPKLHPYMFTGANKPVITSQYRKPIRRVYENDKLMEMKQALEIKIGSDSGGMRPVVIKKRESLNDLSPREIALYLYFRTEILDAIDRYANAKAILTRHGIVKNKRDVQSIVEEFKKWSNPITEDKPLSSQARAWLKKVVNHVHPFLDGDDLSAFIDVYGEYLTSSDKEK